MSKAGASSGRLDLFGSIISISCAIHCLAFPILLSMGSFMALASPAHHVAELVLLAFSLLICLWSLLSAHPIHKRMAPIYLLIVSIAVFTIAQFAPAHVLETTLNVTGAILITLAHLINRRYLKAA